MAVVEGVPAASLAYQNPSGVLHDSDENISRGGGGGGEEKETLGGESADADQAGIMGVATERRSGEDGGGTAVGDVHGGRGGGTSVGDSIGTGSSRFRYSAGKNKKSLQLGRSSQKNNSGLDCN